MIAAEILPADTWDIAKLRDHIGREAFATDRITQRVAAQLWDVIGADVEPSDDLAPLGIQWCLATPDVALDGLQEDGHPRTEHTILPPVPSARRMWAGGEIVWHDALRIGDEVTRRSVVTDVSIKEGRSGVLCFVTVRHDYATGRGAAITERQDIVYKQADAGDRPGRRGLVVPATPAGTVLQRLKTDPIRLFRYSALTGNAHRIHYDHPYATGVGGYPGLVVHGPLQATLLMLAAETLADQPPSRLGYRAVSPIFCGHDLIVSCVGTAPAASLWTSGGGNVGMRADATWGPT